MKVQLRISHLDSRHPLPLEDVKAQLYLKAADMNVKSAKQNVRISTEMFYYKEVELLNYLENVQKAIAAK